MEHELPDLPYPANALEPFISEETLLYHHGKHHKNYVEKTNSLVKGTEFENQTLEQIIQKATGPLFNNAAQAWNHTFLWQCLSPSKSTIAGKLASAVERDFGSEDRFFTQFKEKAMAEFGSGYLWLVKDLVSKTLSLETTSNAENPLRQGKQPLFTCDLWEHAYYIDYRNERAKFVDAFLAVANWDFAAGNLVSLWKIAA